MHVDPRDGAADAAAAERCQGSAVRTLPNGFCTNIWEVHVTNAQTVSAINEN